MKSEFERWILKNFSGQKMNTPPKDWNQQVEFFYKINETHYRIKFQEVPTKFRKALGIPKVSSLK